MSENNEVTIMKSFYKHIMIRNGYVITLFWKRLNVLKEKDQKKNRIQEKRENKGKMNTTKEKEIKDKGSYIKRLVDWKPKANSLE
jgi:hypothetical protein